MRANRPALRPALAAAVAAAALAAGSAAAAAVGASAIVLPQNPNHVLISQSQINSGDFAYADVVTSIGTAFANANQSPGRLAGQASVILQSGDPNTSGALQSGASAFSSEALRVGSDFCIGTSCAPADGVGSVALSFDVRASGGTSAFTLDPRANAALSSIGFGWSLGTASGGGFKRSSTCCGPEGVIETQSAVVLVRLGDILALNMNFDVFATANVAQFHNTGFDSSQSSAFADFQHTLEWGGVTGFQAFDPAGAPLALDPNGRFSLTNAEGLDFWNGAASFAGPVPEPSGWALMIAGFGGVGAIIRRRRAAAA